jgi:hypothetical protein
MIDCASRIASILSETMNVLGFCCQQDEVEGGVKEELKLMRIISGGQTGVDRAALDVGLELGIPIGGYCPKGRRSEDGTIPAQYPMIETSTANYGTRTEKNVIESDGTLVLNVGQVSSGTAYTIKLANRHKKPFLAVQLDGDVSCEAVLNCLATKQIKVLNVAGPRESKIPGIHRQTFEFLSVLLTGETTREQ